MMTRLERDREALIKSLMQTAKDFRWHNRLDYDSVVQVKVPDGMKHLMTRRDLEFLKVFSIRVEDWQMVND